MFRTKTSRGKHTLLYRRWMDLKSRTKGNSTRNPEIYKGLKVGWSSFAEFREWAIRHGFSKLTSSPDRIKGHLGYTPDNVRFVTVAENKASSSTIRRGAQPSGPEPPRYYDDDEVPF